MQLVYQGKTKDLYQLKDGRFQFQFKDDATGTEGVFDPGANQVGLKIAGMGRANVQLSDYFFKLFEVQGIDTHWIESNPEQGTMIVEKADFFGQGIEVICRYKAVGSFIRRYGAYVDSGTDLNGYVEITLKDDERADPLINEDALVLLGILNRGEYEQIKQKTLKISELIRNDLATKNLELYDLKLEFGRRKNSTDIILIDEVSGGNMRVFQGERSIGPLELVDFF